MSRKLSLWLVAVAAVGVVVVGLGRRERPKEVAPRSSAALAVPASSVAATVARREAAPLDAQEDRGLAVLPPEDVEWVLDAVARTESVRELSEGDREALIAQLASVRRFAVLERTEPMAVEPEVGP